MFPLYSAWHLSVKGLGPSSTGTHPERLIHACWILGRDPEYRTLRRWAHMLGFGGHFLTKARHYSITFRDLRLVRLLASHRSALADPVLMVIEPIASFVSAGQG